MRLLHFVISVLLILPLPAFAGQVEGEMKIGNKVIAPRHVAAFALHDKTNNKKEVLVVLTEKEIDATAAVLALDPYTNLINQEPMRSGNAIVFTVSSDGSVAMYASFGGTIGKYLDNNKSGIKAEITENDGKKISGRIYTPKPLNSFYGYVNDAKLESGQTWSLDTKFSTELSTVPNAKLLPAGGGEPGKALKELQSATTAKDFSAIRSKLSQKTLGKVEADYKTPEENLQSALELLDWELPKGKMEISGGELRDDTAILEVIGEESGAKILYLVLMNKTDSGWVYERAAKMGFIE